MTKRLNYLHHDWVVTLTVMYDSAWAGGSATHLIFPGHPGPCTFQAWADSSPWLLTQPDQLVDWLVFRYVACIAIAWISCNNCCQGWKPSSSFNEPGVTWVNRLTPRVLDLLTLREVLMKRHCVLKELSRVERDKGTTNKLLTQVWCCDCVEQE